MSAALVDGVVGKSVIAMERVIYSTDEIATGRLYERSRPNCIKVREEDSTYKCSQVKRPRLKLISSRVTNHHWNHISNIRCRNGHGEDGVNSLISGKNKEAQK